MRPRIGRQEAAPVRDEHLQAGMGVQDAVEDEMAHRDGGIQRVADDVHEVVLAQPSALGEAVRVQEHEGAQRLGPGKERTKGGAGQFRAIHVGADLHAPQPQLPHEAVQLRDGQLGRLHRHRAQADEAVRSLGHRSRQSDR